MGPPKMPGVHQPSTFSRKVSISMFILTVSAISILDCISTLGQRSELYSLLPELMAMGFRLKYGVFIGRKPNTKYTGRPTAGSISR